MSNEITNLMNSTPAWTTTADGHNVTRAEYLDLLIEEALQDCNPLDSLIEAINADKRKTFSKRVLLELIEEYR